MPKGEIRFVVAVVGTEPPTVRIDWNDAQGVDLAPETALRLLISLQGAIRALVMNGYEIDMDSITEMGTYVREPEKPN